MIREDPVLNEIWICDVLPEFKLTEAKNFRERLDFRANNSLNML